MLALLAGCTPLELDAPDVAGEDALACDRLVAALPSTVADAERRELSGSRVAAWGDPPIELRCGVARPAGWNRAASCTTVDGVDWFVPEAFADAGDVPVTVVNRSVYVEVLVPEEYLPPAAAMADLGSAMATLEPTGRCR